MASSQSTYKLNKRYANGIHQRKPIMIVVFYSKPNGEVYIKEECFYTPNVIVTFTKTA